jgi:hypothetical protein
MFASAFNWIRTQTRNAVLAGFGDAVAELEGDGTSDAAPALTQLRARFQPALTGPAATSAATTPANVHNEPVGETLPETTQAPANRLNGRRKATAATE